MAAITIRVDDAHVRQMMKVLPAQTMRAAEKAIDKTAFAVRAEVRAEMPKVFDRPTPYTLNSLRVETTRSHNMEAKVWFKEPDRMVQHYLVPQVEGGQRKLKGFERALDQTPFVPARVGPKLDRYGNLPYGRIVQILSVLGRAEYVAGYAANITGRSKKRNRKPRDYVQLKQRHGKLPPGIYERFQTSVGFGAKTKKSLPFGEHQRGRTKGRFSSAIRARGLRPILVEAKQMHVRPRLPFYEIGARVVATRLRAIFEAEFRALVGLR